MTLKKVILYSLIMVCLLDNVRHVTCYMYVVLSSNFNSLYSFPFSYILSDLIETNVFWHSEVRRFLVHEVSTFAYCAKSPASCYARIIR